MSFSPITLGKVLRSRTVGPFSVTQTEHRARTVLSMHAHERANVTLIVRGAFREAVRARSFSTAPSDILVKAPGERHANEYGSTAARCLTIEMSDEALARLGDGAAVFQRSALMRGSAASVALRGILRELLFDDATSAMAIEDRVAEAVAELARAGGTARHPRWLADVRRYLDEHFADDDASLAGVADTFGIPRVQVARWFRRASGATIGEYVRNRRIDYVQQRLRGSGSIADIAVHAGFADHAHLCRVFRRVTGMTPTEARQAMQR